MERSNIVHTYSQEGLGKRYNHYRYSHFDAEFYKHVCLLVDTLRNIMLICYHHDANNGMGEISQLPVPLNELFTFLVITLVQFQ